MTDRDLLKKALGALEPMASRAAIYSGYDGASFVSMAVAIDDLRCARAVHAEIKAALDSDAARTGQDAEEG